MTTVRLEAFSDAVIAIIITIMVLELKVPHGTHIKDLAPLLPVFLSYIVSFLYVGIYWNNHHHLLKTCKEVTGSILWANLHLLFWLSLLPFAAGWLGENHYASAPTALYACVLLMAGAAYYFLQQAIMRAQGGRSILKRAIGKDWKAKLSLLLYVVALFATLCAPGIAQALLVVGGLLWLVPDRRIEKGLATVHPQ
ncbi:TMEM175 family protein [Terriglobus sp. TAA 43]|uniref:TMEM175 family protein n=1 Tax=Terriglobus sp. TAA 43 TaxID=278961 RepID=UPI0006478AE6|nr:TMEM175 family protein [Terriglobus sp. TAA 43]